jgi:diguanylate cyclase (GGDEF)-like protein
VVAALQVTAPPLPGRGRLLGGVSGRLTAGLIGLLLLTATVSAGAIYQMHRMTASLDRLVQDNFEPLLDAQDLVQRVQILVALSPKLLNARNSFEIDNLQLQIVDMFDMLDSGLEQIRASGSLTSHGAAIARQRDALHAAIDQLIALVRRQMQLRDDIVHARHRVDVLLNPAKSAVTVAEGGNARGAALAAVLYQASLATDPSEIDRGRTAVRALLDHPAADGLSLQASQIAALIDGDSSVFAIRRLQIDLEQKLQGEAGNTNLRANQLVYAVTNLGAELRRLTQQARRQARESVHRATIRTSIVMLIAAVMAATLVVYLRISVLQRLVALRNGVASSAAGARVDVADDGRDEIGDLARSLRHFIEVIGAKEDELRLLAATDVLTGLANRRDFMFRAEAEMLRTRRYNFPLCVMMMDIDHFKKVNDTWGHAAGDEVIRQVAAIARDICRSVDIVGRIGGEEFAVLLPQTSINGALIVAERLREMVAGRSVAISRGQSINVSISVGVAETAAERDELAPLLGRADAALYEAKQRGRNRVCVAKPSGSGATSAKEAVLY